MGNLQLTCFTK